MRIVRLMTGERQQTGKSSGQRENKIRQFAKANGITYREAVLLSFMMEVLEGRVEARERGAIFTEAIGRLAGTKIEA